MSRGGDSLLVLLALASLTACGHGDVVPAHRTRPGAADGRVYHYRDNRGLTVLTYGAVVSQPVSRDVTVDVQGLADRIVVERQGHTHTDLGNQDTGHRHDGVDAVSSASVTVLGGETLEKTRVEGTVGVTVDSRVGEAPTQVQAMARVSHEQDYRSYAGRVRVTTELAQRNTTLSAFVGYGHDTSSPVTAPPGEGEAWPATHQRLTAGASVRQLLGERLSGAVGVGASHQEGTLANPYRRALVRTTLFPERVPDQRQRFTGFASLAIYLGQGTALHLRQGGYLDTWGVRALIPEAAVVAELGEAVLTSLRYRYYRQAAATFYQPVYQRLAARLSGDLRLGDIEAHHPSIDLAWTVLGRRGDFGALTVSASYGLTWLDYAQLQQERVRVQLASIGVGGSY